MSTPRTCPTCGEVLPAEAVDGPCETCRSAEQRASASTVIAPSTAGTAPAPGQRAPRPPGTDAAGSLSQNQEPRLADSESGAAVSGAPARLAVGARFGKYGIVRLLGRGGMGEVYEADDTESGRRVALKVLSHSLDSPDARRRFLREGRLAASTNHPNSVYIFGTEEIEEIPVISMELVRGGTLKERVRRQGPLPVGQAVDAILQVIAGLEAAQAVGVLHRDVKPSNCFTDSEGMVKVGDFGLSVSTLARTEHSLTISGSILGTPAFSSPEQLRGDELDARSDIYAVGMTLYYPLTGRTAFEGDNVMRLLSTILEQSPPSPTALRREVPRELAQVVLRCLAKKPADRFRSYAELRLALQPFSSTSPVPASLGVRFSAGVVDFLLIAAFSGVLQQVTGPHYLGWTERAQFFSPLFLAYAAAGLVFNYVYGGIPEGLWGASPGKALFRLRVVGPNRDAPGIPLATWRAFWFWFLGSAFYVVSFVIDPRSANTGSLALWASLVSIVSPALLFVTARRRNGLAAIHDLLSHTRVIQKPRYGVRPVLPILQEPPPVIGTQLKLGPYHVLGRLGGEGGQPPAPESPSPGPAGGPAAGHASGSTVAQPAISGAGLWLGYDAQLQRRVWLRTLTREEAASTAAPTMLSRAGRLRWLNGRRAAQENWDAYEAPSGSPLLSLIREPQPWGAVRYWLADLAQELGAATKDGSLPEALGLDRVWITGDGRAKLLDFPAPGAEPQPVAQGKSESGFIPARTFLQQVALAASEGRVLTPEQAQGAEPRLPLPLHARGFLRELRAIAAPEQVVARLQPLLQRVAAVSRKRRLLLLVGCVFPWVMCVGFFMMGFAIARSLFEKHPDSRAMRPALERLSALRQVNPAPESSEGKERRALEVFIRVQWPEMSANPMQMGVGGRGLTEEQRRFAGQLAAESRPSPAELQEAKALLKPFLEKHRVNMPGVRSEFFVREMAFGACLGFWCYTTALPSLLAAVLCRGGFVLHLLGLSVVTREGSPASRLRVLWRNLVAWSPLLALLGLHASAVRGSDALVFPLLAVQLAGAVWALRDPTRGLQDRLAGTCLAPR